MAGWGKVERLRVARRSAILTLAVAASLMAASVSTASAEITPCTTAVGEAQFGEGPEIQHLRNALSTNLTESQKLFFAWEHGKFKFKLTELESAHCGITLRGRTFRGLGEGTLNGVSEYLIRFAIKINAEEEVTLIAKVSNEVTKEVVEEFVDEGLEESTEEIA